MLSLEWCWINLFVKIEGPNKECELSICASDPFFKESFQNIDITTNDYHRYLVGKADPKSVYRSIEFNNVSINLSKYIKEFKVQWSDHTSNVCNSSKECAFAEFKNSFNGFWYAGPLFKCFSIGPIVNTSRAIRDIWIRFEPELPCPLSKYNGLPPLSFQPIQSQFVQWINLHTLL